MGRDLPFRFTGQARPSPAGEGVGLKPAEVAHRRLGVAGPAPGQGEFPVAAPVAGGLPAPLVGHGPAFAHPQLGTPVAAIGDEPLKGAVAHQLAGDLEGLKPNAVTGSLVIEMEAADGRIGADLALGVADRHQAPGVVQPSGGLARLRSLAGAGLKAVFRTITGEAVAGFEWIAAEAVQQVHQQQLLVLLLVLQPQLDQGQGRCRLLGIEPVQPFQQAL